MLRIEEPILFYALLLLPLLAIVCFFYMKYAIKLSAYFSVLPEQALASRARLKKRFICFMLGLLFMCLALTNPQYGYRKEKVDHESADVFIALDISQSMLAEDLSPSRLERAKKIGERFISELKTERIGLIFFAGEAYLQMPLTTDYRTAIVFLRNASPEQAGLQGTAIGDAIEMASKRTEDDLSPKRRTLIIITDGEDHEGEAAKLAKTAFESGTAVFTVGVGTSEGGFIPIKHGGQSDYLRDQSGQPVRTRINTSDLEEIARQGGGLFFDYQVGKDMYETVKEKVQRMERRNYEKTLFTARESYFQYLLLPGIILLALPFLWPLFRSTTSANETNK